MDMNKYLQQVQDPNVVTLIKTLIDRQAALGRIHDMFLNKMDEFFDCIKTHKRAIEVLQVRVDELKTDSTKLEKEVHDIRSTEYYD